MIGHFPDPYPEEIFYSACARMGHRIGLNPVNDVSMALFGNPYTSVQIEWPYKLHQLFQQLPPSFNYATELILDLHSNLKLYAPFQPSRRYEKVVGAILDGERHCRVLPRLGIAHYRGRNPPVLRYCASCTRGDREEFGEAYWHRIHQASGVVICPTHQEILHIARVFETPLNSSQDRFSYFPAEDECKESTAPSASWTHQELAFLLAVATDMDWLLRKNNYCPGPLILAEWYRLELISQRLAAPVSQAAYSQKIHEMFFERFPNSILKALGVEMPATFAQDWLTRLTHNRNKAQPPLYHILFMRLLGFDAESFFQKYALKQTSKAAGSFLCLNPVCEYTGRRIITSYTLKKKQPRVVFRCPKCGYTYSRRLPLTETDERKPGSVIDVGPQWLAELEHLWNQPAISMNFMATKLDCASGTLCKFAFRLGFKYPREGMRTGRIPDHFRLQHDRNRLIERTRQRHRATWLALLKSHPQAVISTLDKMAPATLEWLRKHDKQWLSANRPARIFRGGNRKDWNALDQEFARRVEEVGLKLLAQDDFPVPITKLRLTVEIRDFPGRNCYSLGKLTKTTAVIARLKDDANSLALRRAKWANEQSSLPSGWTVELLKRRLGLTIKNTMSESILQIVAKAAEGLITRSSTHGGQNSSMFQGMSDTGGDLISGSCGAQQDEKAALVPA